MSYSSFLNAFFHFFNSTSNATLHIWCDNGSNFKAGSKALTQSFKNVDWKGVIDKWSACGISWKFIPPFSPSKGGNWERMVGLSKNLISAIAARDYYRAMNSEELSTYFKEVQGILNWRPLTGVSSKMNDFEYLSPMSLLNSALVPSVLPDQILKSKSVRKS